MEDGKTVWLTDADGDMIRTTGDDGKDGEDGEDGKTRSDTSYRKKWQLVDRYNRHGNKSPR